MALPRLGMQARGIGEHTVEVEQAALSQAGQHAGPHFRMVRGHQFTMPGGSARVPSLVRPGYMPGPHFSTALIS